MSTYYELKCEDCDETGGFFSRQAWGCGNADIIETMRFIFKHKNCDHIKPISEHSMDYGDDYSLNHDKRLLNDLEYELSVCKNFPCSSDWSFVSEVDDDKSAKKEYIKDKLKNDFLKRDDDRKKVAYFMEEEIDGSLINELERVFDKSWDKVFDEIIEELGNDE